MSFWLSQSRLEKAIVQPTVVEPTLPVLEAISLLAEAASSARCGLGTEADGLIERWIDGLAVVESNQLRGLFDQRMAMQLVASGRSLSDVTLAEVIQPTVSLQRSELLSFETAFQNLQQQQVRHLPILESDGQLVGIITWESLCCLRQVAELTYSITAEIESQIGSHTQAQIAALTSQVEQSQLLMAVSMRIRDSLSLTEIFETTVNEVRQVLGCDRVSIYRFLEDWQFQVVAESIAASQHSFVTEIVHDPCFDTNWETWYSQGRVQTITDIYTAGLTPCHLELLERLQMRAKVLVPIVVDQQLWGFISASESAAPRHWQPSEVAFLEQLGVQVAIAVQQGQNHTLLYQHRQELEALLNHAPDVIFRLDQNLHYLYVNAAIESELGYSSETIIGQDLLVAALAPEYLAEWRAVIQQVMTTRQESSIEYPLHLPDRSIWFQTRVVPEYDKGGALASFLCVARNITQQKQAAVKQTAYIDLLMEWQARYHAAQQASGQALYEWDIIADHVTWGSNTEQVFGYSAIDMPQTFADCLLRVHPEDVEQIRSTTEDYLKHQRSLCLQYRWQHRDGHYFWIEDQAQFFEDLKGNSTRVVGYVADISERKRLEAERQQVEHQLRQREAFLSSIYDGAELSIFVVEVTETNDFRYVSFNHKAQQTTGLSIQDIENKTPEEVFGAEIGTLFRQNYDRCLQTGHGITCEDQFIFGDRPVWVLTTLSPLRDQQERIYRLVGTTLEVTEQRQVEAALRKNEEMLRFALTAAQAGTWDWDLTQERATLSVETYQIYGIDLADPTPTYEEWCDCLHPDDRQFVSDYYTQLLTRHRSEIQLEFRFLHPQLGVRWLLSLGRTTVNQQGEPIRISGINLDITDRKRAELALQESEADFRAMFTLTGVGVAQIEPKARRFRRVNAAFCAITGYTEAELLDLTVDQLNHPDDRTLDQQHYRNMLQSDHYQLEKRYQRKDGSTIWVTVTGNLIRNAEGQPVRAFAMIRDISDRKQAEEALRQSEARYRYLVELSPQLVWNADAQGHTTYVSQQMCDYIGVTAEQLLDFNWQTAIHPDDVEQIHRRWMESVQTGVAYEVEYRLRRADGVYRWQLVQAIAHQSEQGIEWFGTSTDISDHKRREAHLAFLSDLTNDLSCLTTADEMMQTLGAKVGGYFNVSSCLFGVINEAQEQAVIEHSWHISDTPDLKGTYRLSEFISADLRQAAQAGETIVIQDTQTDHRVNHEQFIALQIHTCIMIPFQWNGEWSRVFVVTTPVACNWRKDEVELIEEISSRLFLRLERARAEATIAANLRDAQQLRDLSTRLIIEDNVQVLYSEILTTAIALMQADMGSLQILNLEQNELRLETCRGFHPDAATYWYSVTADGNSACSAVLQQGKRIIVPDVETCDFLAGTTDLDFLRLCGIRAIQSTPLINRFGQVIGIFSTHWRKPYELSDREQWFLDLLARQAADLIEQRQAETALRENEEMLRLALSGAKAGTWDWNMQTNHLNWSAESYHLYGLDLDRDVPQQDDWYNILHPNDRGQVQQYFDRAIEQRLNSFELEFRAIHPQLGIRWILDLGLITWNEQGEPIRMSGINLDITDRKQAEIELVQRAGALEIANCELNALAEQLKAQEEYLLTQADVLIAQQQRYLNLFNFAPDAYFVTDTKGVIQEVNQAAAALLGRSAAWLIDKPLSLFVSEGQAFYDRLGQLRRQPSTQQWEMHLGASDRLSSVPVAVIVAPSRDPQGQITGYRWLGRDITEQKQAEAALRASEQKLRQVTDSLPGVVFQYRLDADGTISFPFISRGIADLYGLTPEQVLNNPQCMWDVVHPEDLPEMRTSSMTSATTLTIWQHEYRIQVNGTWKWVLGQSYPFPQEDGSILWSGFISDISDRKQLELALRESETQLRQIFDNSQDVFFLKAAGSNQMIYTSPAWEELYQTPLQQTYDNPQIWLDFVHPDDRNRMIAMGEQVRQGHRFHSCEHRIIRPDGSIRWVWQRAFPICDAAGQIYRIAGINTDITEQKQIEAELQLKAQIIDQVHDAVVATNLDGQIEFWNQGAERLFGYTATEAIGRHIAFVYPDQQHALLQSPVSESLQAQGECTVELKMRRKSGEDFWAHLSLSVRYNSAGEAIGRIGYSIDISDRKRIEAERRQAEIELQKFATLADNSSDFIGMCDLNFIPFYINEAGKQMIGLADLQEFSATPVQDFFFPEDQDFILNQFFPQVMRDGQAEVEVRFRHFQTGAALWILYNVIYIKDEQGQPIALATVSRNITERKQSELELQRREAILQAFMTASPIAMTLFDRDLQFLYGNEALAQLNNKPLSEHLGHTLWDIVPDIAPQFAPTLLQIIETQEPVLNVEFAGEVRPGVFRSTIANHYPVTLPNGEVIGVGMTVMDVTDLTLARQELQESQEQLRLAFEASRMGTWDWNIQSGKIFWSANLEAFFGMEPGDFDGTFEMFNQCVHPDDREPVQLAVQQAIATGEDYDTEFRVVHPNGRIRWAQGKGKVFYDEKGQPIRMAGVDFDITERKQAEIALRESETRFRTMADNISQFAWMTDENGWIFWYNQRWFDFTGTTLEEMEGWGWQKVHHPEHVDRVVAKIRGCFETGEVWEDTFPLRSKDGDYRWFLSRAIPIRDERGNVWRWFGTNTDITEQRNTELALKQTTDRLDMALRSAPINLSSQDLDLRYTWAYQPKYYSVEAILGRRDEELVTTETAGYITQLKQQVIDTGVGNRQEVAIEFPGVGQTSYFDLAIESIRDSQNAIVGITCAAVDITDRKQAEIALRESEEFNQRILDSSQDCIKVLTLEGNLLYVNPGGLCSLEVDHLSQILGMNWVDFWQGQDLKQAQAAIDAARAGHLGQLIGYCPTLKGNFKWWDVRVTPFRDAAGQVIKLVVISRDITSQKQAETALRASEQTLSQVINTVPGAFYRYRRSVHPAEAEGFTFISEGITALYGYTPAEILNNMQLVWDMILPEDMAQMATSIDQSAATLDPWRLEFRIRMPDGSLKWISGRSTPTRQENGDILWFGFLTDITDRKQIELALQESEEFNQSILDSSRDCIKVLSLAGEILFINSGGLTGLAAEHPSQLLHSDWSTFWQGETREQVRRAIQLAATGTTARLQGSCPTLKGQPKWWDNILTPMRDATGEINKIAVISRDITEQKQIEAALRDSEQRYRDLAEAMPQMVWTADTSGDVTYFNQRWYDYTGLSEAESIGLNCLVAFHPDDREPSLQNWTAAVASSMSFQIEARFRSVDGDYRWFISRALPIQNSEGAVIQWIGTITDIHDRKQAEAALQASEQTLSQVINTVPGAVYEFRRSFDGVEQFTFMSRGVIDLYEHTPEELLRDVNTEWNLILPEDRDEVEATVMQSGRTLTPWELEFRIRTPSGALKWVLGRSTPARQEDGSISWFGFLSDITDRKRTELALQASEQRYINLAELSPVGIFHTQANGDCIYVNSRWCQLAGLTVEAARGQGWQQAIHPDDRERVFQAWYDAIQFQTSFLIECRFQTPEGVIHWLIAQAQAQLDDAGYITGYIGTITDITERKQAEQALQRSEARFRAVFEQAAVGIAEVDLSGRFIRVNPGYYDLFGYSEVELLACSFQDITPISEELERDLIYQQWLLAGEIDSFSIEKQMLRKDKELRWCNVTVSPIRNAEGVIERCLGVVQDIHQRKQAELALQQLNQELELRIAQRTAALSQSEARYRSLFEQAAVGISRCDLSGRYLQVNQRFCELTGYTEAELLERTWQDITHPDDLFKTSPDQMSLQSDQLPSITIEKRYISKTGQLRWVSLTLSFLHDQNEIISDLAVIQDISEKVQLEAERKEIELKLQDSEKRLREIISKTVDGILILDTDGKILFCNPAAARIFGCHSTDCSNEPLNGRVLGIPTTFKKAFELEIPGGERDLTTVEVRVEEITWQDQKAFLAGVRDISDRKQAERELEESELSYRTLAENLPGIVYKLFPEENNKLVFFNDRITTLLNLELADLSEAGTVCRLESLIVPEDRDRVIQTIQMAIARQESFQVEYCIQHPRTRERKYLLEQGKPVISNPEIGETRQSLHIVGIIFDVTETKQAAEQLRQINTQLSLANAELARATRLKDEFLANMSHELRTPLNSVLGLSEVLQEGTYGNLTEQQQRALSTIQTNGQHLLELINDILDLAKIESGKLEPQIVTVAVQRLCQSTVPFIQQQALQKEIKFTLDLAADLGYIEVDERLIRQVLINLLSNAVKFTASGGSVQLKVQGNVVEQCLYFHVIDTGIGIGPNDIKKLFHPFVQIDSSLSRRYAGTGLGLALVRRIVELHQGTVTVSSNIGVGSQFTVQLPWQPISPNSSRLLPPAADYPTASADSKYSEATENPVILLVDDNVDNVETLRAYLELKGFTIIVATNGKEAVQMAQTQPVNLILMDIQMPDMNGLEAICRIRSSESVQTPILAITALAMPGDKEKCLAAGANGYLSKPISPTQLVKIIYQHLHPIQA